MQTAIEGVVTAYKWKSERLANGGYRIQAIEPTSDLSDLNGFKNCTECSMFADQLECVQQAMNLQSTGLWIGLVNRKGIHADVVAVLWEL